MQIVWQDLSAVALAGVLEEYVTREGTDYGHLNIALEVKVAAVRRQLEAGEVVINWDPDTGTVDLRPVDPERPNSARNPAN